MAFSGSCSEHPLALQVDHLPRLGERKRHRIVERGEGVGADETMLLAHTADLTLDRPRRLKLASVLNGAGRMMKPLYSTGSETFSAGAGASFPNKALRSDITGSRVQKRKRGSQP